MAKKNKRNIKALLAKRAELQALSQKPTLTIPGAPIGAAKPLGELPAPETAIAGTLPEHHDGREIWRTMIATGIIAALLVAVIIVDKQQPFLDKFGTTLYNALQLGD